MNPVDVVRDTTTDDVGAALRLLASALTCTLLLGLLAGGAFVVLLLPLAVLATLHPTLTFGGVPPTQYPPAHLGVQGVWTVLLALGLRAVGRSRWLQSRSAAGTETALPDRYPSTPRNERVAGLVAAVEPTEQD